MGDATYIKGTYCCDLVEILRDGVWQEVPKIGDRRREGTVGSYNVDSWTDFGAHRTKEKSMSFPSILDGEEVETAVTRYLPLEAGEYRLRVQYILFSENDEAEIPEGKLEAVAYFTVTAPAE